MTGRPELSSPLLSDLAWAQEVLGGYNHTEDDHYHFDQHGQQQCCNHGPEHFSAENQHLRLLSRITTTARPEAPQSGSRGTQVVGEIFRSSCAGRNGGWSSSSAQVRDSPPKNLRQTSIRLPVREPDSSAQSGTNPVREIFDDRT